MFKIYFCSVTGHTTSRDSSSVNFNRSWSQYQHGFGFLSTDFWLGNEKLSYLTNQADYELRVDIELSNGASFFTTYSGFRITDEWGQYQITHVGGIESNAETSIATCPTNMIYGTYRCQATCEDPNERSGCNSDSVGSEGCTCPAGFLMQGSDCINASECGCFVTEANLVIPVFQRRTDGSTSFYQNWAAYKEGFGDSRNLWLGNEKLHYLTTQKTYKLRFEITTSSGSAKYAEYPEFQIDSESSNYTMNKLADRSSGNTGYYLYYSRGKQFSTYDRDNDACGHVHCAEKHRSGWWHFNHSYYCVSCYSSSSYCDRFQYNGNCHSVCTYDNLNGDYNGGNGEIFSDYSNNCNVRSVEMKIRPSA
ncbi:Angiopoietin-4 [Apostichopus japonicus]|uniref:Angiopoietin-4 n=1 Tax=Stichopus japonicus TaxID=307972 RepID=A0A2G8LEE1_STIJA|nr:Angiopoietin-4 [Apostichopus japonicus]